LKVATHVIVRISSTIVSESQLGSYLADLESSVIPSYEAAAGMVRVYLLQQRFVAYVEVLTVSLWHSQDGLGRFVEGQSLTEDVGQKHGVIEVEPRSFDVLLSRRGKLPADEEPRQT
jgi:hypothetical protein